MKPGQATMCLPPMDLDAGLRPPRRGTKNQGRPRGNDSSQLQGKPDCHARAEVSI